MTEQLLVIGGSSPWDSHRLRETVETLRVLDSIRGAAYEEMVKGCDSTLQLASVVGGIAYLGYNLVGSRGYCYDAKKIAEIIRERNPNFNLITRNGGLREKYIQLYLKEKSNE